MTEHGAKTAADFQRRLDASPQDAEHAFKLAYRAMVLDALQALPRRVLPHDLGSMGIMVEAAELFSGALYFLRGSRKTKGFLGEGLDDVQEWLQRCRALFERYDSLYSELTPPRPKAGDPRRVAAAYWAIVNQLFSGILEHANIQREAAEEARDGSDDGDIQQEIVAIPADTFTDIAKALGTVMCCWFDQFYANVLMATISDGAGALYQCQSLANAAAPGSARGNA